MIIRSLAPGDDRSAFRSGSIDLDRFFQRFAGQSQFRHYVGVTYVAVDGESIQGFVAVTAASIEVSSLSPALRKKLPVYPIPVLRLARLAVCEAAQGLGIGSSLLRYVFLLAHEMARRIGCVGVVVDAKEEAVPFYERYGFEALDVEAGRLGDRPVPKPMFLELGAISKPGKPAM
jgi:GNAT superfamily N-acetyltransferase